jgi:hypothetical protein
MTEEGWLRSSGDVSEISKLIYLLGSKISLPQNTFKLQGYT